MATSLNITIDQGSAFNHTIYHLRSNTGVAIDLTGWTGTAKLKKKYTANTSYSITVTLGVNGSVTLSANSVQTAAIPPGWYVYDVVVLNSQINDYQRILQGVALVSPGVTAPGSTVLWSDVPPPAPPGEGGGTPADPTEGAAIPNTN